MLGRMEGLGGSGDLDGRDLSVECLDLRGVGMFQLLCDGSVILVPAQLLPAISGFLPAFLRLCVWLQLISGLLSCSLLGRKLIGQMSFLHF